MRDTLCPCFHTACVHAEQISVRSGDGILQMLAQVWDSFQVVPYKQVFTTLESGDLTVGLPLRHGAGGVVSVMCKWAACFDMAIALQATWHRQNHGS